MALAVVYVLAFSTYTPSSLFSISQSDFSIDGHPVSYDISQSGNVQSYREGNTFTVQGSQDRNAQSRGGSGSVTLTFGDISNMQSFSVDHVMAASVSGDQRADPSASATITVGSASCSKSAQVSNPVSQSILLVKKLDDNIYEIITICGKEVIQHNGPLRPQMNIDISLSNSAYEHGAMASISIQKVNLPQLSVPVKEKSFLEIIIGYIQNFLMSLLSAFN